jgi:hypothetical protein
LDETPPAAEFPPLAVLLVVLVPPALWLLVPAIVELPPTPVTALLVPLPVSVCDEPPSAWAVLLAPALLELAMPPLPLFVADEELPPLVVSL